MKKKIFVNGYEASNLKNSKKEKCVLIFEYVQVYLLSSKIEI